jgi:hypothetical protein
VAAVVAGACWVVKAAGILLTGEQPPILFEAGYVLFPVALVGLYATMGRRGGRLALCGLVLAVTTEVSAVVVGFGVLFGPDDWMPSEDTVTVLTPFFVLAGVGTFAALLLLGLAVRRTRALAGRWQILPLALAVSAVPLMVIGGALEVVNERLLEVPILLLGVAWIGLGVVVARVASHDTQEAESRPHGGMLHRDTSASRGDSS